MGRHFDSLDEVIKKPLLVPSLIFDINITEFLEEHKKNADVMEIPYHSSYLQPISGRNKKEYHKFLDEYIELLDESNFFQEIPVGIEDPQSYVAVQKMKDDEYSIINCANYGENTLLESGIISKPYIDNENIVSVFSPLFAFVIYDENVAYLKPEYTAASMANALTAYIEEAAYLDSLLK